ncbi:uncharacterized protein ISCGN_000325, partial [Ixodes scapularis]
SPPREGSPGAESFCSALSEGAESFYSALSDQRSTHSVYYDAEASELESSDSDSRYADADEEFAPEQVVVVPDDSDTTASASGVADDDFESFSYGKIFEDVYGSVIHRPPPVKSQRKGDAREKDFGNEPAENLPQRRSFPRGAYRAPATSWMSSELPGQLGFLQTEQPSPSFEQEATERGNTEVLLMSLLEEVADEFAEFIIDEALLEAPKKYGNRLWWNEANDSECETIIKDDNTGVKLLGSRRCLEESQNGHWETFEHGSFVGEEDLEKMSVEERDILDEFDKHFEPCLDSEEEPDSHAFDDVSEEELESWGESEREEKGLLNKNALLGKFKRFPQSGEKKGALNRGHSLSDGSRDGSTPKCFPLPPVPATSSAELTGSLFDDNVPLDVVSLKVVDNCDFLKDSDDMSPPYVMKLDPGKDLSAFLVDPDCSEWNRSDDIDCATPEDVSRHALEVDAGLSCASADCESLSSAEQWDSETWIGSPLEGGFQQQQQQQELKDLFEATPPLSHTGSFQGAVTCAADEGRPSLTVQPADNTNLSGEALSGEVARGSGEIPPLHSTSCPPYHDSLPANGGSVAQTNSDCFDVFSETSNTCARAFSSVAALQRDVKDMAPERIDGQAYLNTIELASSADLKRYFLEAYDGRPAEGKESN